MNNTLKKRVINQQVLEKLGDGDEFFQEVQLESKPSRIDSRRQRAEQHEHKKARRRNFEDYND
jgi:hypothetical protein